MYLCARGVVFASQSCICVLGVSCLPLSHVFVCRGVVFASQSCSCVLGVSCLPLSHVFVC